MAAENPQKPIHSLILDTGPLIKNAVSSSTLINSAEELFTTPAIISEIRDEATRSRVQTTLMPFLTIRTPSPASYDAVIAFSKKTGDHAVLSRQDLGILALAYEVHCERNGGPWGLRDAPKKELKMKPGSERKAEKEEDLDDGVKVSDAHESRDEVKVNDEVKPVEAEQDELDGFVEVSNKKKKNSQQKSRKGKANPKHIEKQEEAETLQQVHAESHENDEQPSVEPGNTSPTTGEVEVSTETLPTEQISTEQSTTPNAEASTSESVPTQAQIDTAQDASTETPTADIAPQTHEPALQESEPAPEPATEQLPQDLSALNITTPPSPPSTDDDDDDGDWITPSNLTSRQATDSGLSTSTPASQIDVATMTTDFAMQNVLLQMNLHLLSTNMQRIKKLVSKILRCHACFFLERDVSKQFCPRCGGATLKRVNCSTNARGDFRLHLAKNYQFNKRGDKYSIPKPIAGTANTKWSGIGGGQGGWGRDLVLTEDQKEYTRQMEADKRAKGARDLMDDDYLPGILTGDRSGRMGGRVKIGAGKNVNAKKKRT